MLLPAAYMAFMEGEHILGGALIQALFGNRRELKHGEGGGGGG